MRGIRSVISALVLAVPALLHAENSRQTLSLDGLWDVGESVGADAPPRRFDHRVPVPGLVHSAQPAFADVDRFDSREYISNQVKQGRLPESALVHTAGVPHQQRNYFWYRTYFEAPARRERATLQVDKAQFGSEVWVNGRHVGGHVGCSTSASYNVTSALHWSKRNEVVIRIGAHPGVLPDRNPCGIDFEKTRWTPGIYDRVSVFFTDALMIETIQVAPQINPQAILVQATLRNTGKSTRAGAVQFQVHRWKDANIVATAEEQISVAAGSLKVITTRIPLPGAKLWSPEDPNLYVVDSRLPGDERTTRFGLREFHFDTATRRAYLNGRPYFLRGTNITLHRFFEDPLSGQLPWDDAWVTRLLGEKAKRMHWNAMRFCIGPVPQRWLDIADEQGLLIQYEYPIWVFTPRMGYPPLPVKSFDTPQLTEEFAGWMRDAWNHPSIAFWDASNESDMPELGEKVIPAVRGLDLSGRQWENSYNPPAAPDDPVEDHPYKFVTSALPGLGPDFDMAQLENSNGSERFFLTVPTGHATIINEYGWLWLNRDGSPTLLTNSLYPKLPYPHTTAEERRQTYAYLLAGLTEYWRAFRQYAGVLHFVYLTASEPDGYTSDNFKDVRALELDPYFEGYVGEAFKPLGVYINFWHRELPAGVTRDFQVMMINDDDLASRGELSLMLEDASGTAAVKVSIPYELPSNGQQTRLIHLELPPVPGSYVLKAVATPEQGGQSGPTTSRRWVSLVPSTSITH